MSTDNTLISFYCGGIINIIKNFKKNAEVQVLSIEIWNVILGILASILSIFAAIFGFINNKEIKNLKNNEYSNNKQSGKAGRDLNQVIGKNDVRQR